MHMCSFMVERCKISCDDNQVTISLTGLRVELYANHTVSRSLCGIFRGSESLYAQCTQFVTYYLVSLPSESAVPTHCLAPLRVGKLL